MSVPRSLFARVRKLEEARAPVMSPIEQWYGSFGSFEDETRAQVEAGALDRTDMLGETGEGGVIRALRAWHEQALFSIWERNRVWERSR
ncbi:hypothetical protein [Stappia sp.]|uniref:hypothetical protein n=2 Tax=Hyphomicrobiales TaxID=356 RepID=UPI003A9955F6